MPEIGEIIVIIPPNHISVNTKPSVTSSRNQPQDRGILYMENWDLSGSYEGRTQETKVFARLFQKAAQSRRVASSLGWASESSYGALFLIAFSLAPSFSREKAEKSPSRKHPSVQTENRFPLFFDTRGAEESKTQASSVNKKKRRAPAGAELPLFERKARVCFATSVKNFCDASRV